LIINLFITLPFYCLFRPCLIHRFGSSARFAAWIRRASARRSAATIERLSS
jgi:hypothetical protein